MVSEYRQKVLAKTEGSSYGVNPTLAVGTDAYLPISVTPSPSVLEYAERTLIRPHFGQYEQLVTTMKGQMSIVGEYVGFGTAGPATPTPGFSALLKGCGLSQTISAGVSVTYAPQSSGQNSTAIQHEMDTGNVFTYLGGYGNMKVSMRNRAIPTFTFDYTSRLSARTTTPLGAVSVSNYQKVQTVSPDNTTTFTLQGFGSACLNSFEFDMGNEIEYFDFVNCTKNVEIIDRRSSGSVQLEMPALSVKDWFSAVESGTVGTFSLVHGSAGKRITFNGTNVMLTNPRVTYDRKRAMLDMDMLWLPSATGNDEFNMVFA